MNKTKTIISKSFLYLLSIGLLLYVIISIGIVNIYNAFISTDISMVFVSLLFTLIATIIRLYKFGILFNYKDKNSSLEVFISSRIGKEVSFAGFFIPLLKKNNRNDGTLQNLILDRYTEIFATLVLAFISSLFVPKNGYTESIVFFAVAASTLIMIIVPFIKSSLLKKAIKFNFIIRLINFIIVLQEKLRLDSNYILKIYLLSFLATIFDFLTALYIFKAFAIDIQFLLIPIVWASSGLVSMLAFMIIGSTEISVIYLYYLFAGVNKAVTASFVIMSRILNIFILTLLLMYFILFNTIKKNQSIIQ